MVMNCANKAPASLFAAGARRHAGRTSPAKCAGEYVRSPGRAREKPREQPDQIAACPLSMSAGQATHRRPSAGPWLTRPRHQGPERRSRRVAALQQALSRAGRLLLRQYTYRAERCNGQLLANPGSGRKVMGPHASWSSGDGIEIRSTGPMGAGKAVHGQAEAAHAGARCRCENQGDESARGSPSPSRAPAQLKATQPTDEQAPGRRRQDRSRQQERHRATSATVAPKTARPGAKRMARAQRALAPALAASAEMPERARLQAWLADAQLSYHGGEHTRGRPSLQCALRLGERKQLRLPFAIEGPGSGLCRSKTRRDV